MTQLARAAGAAVTIAALVVGALLAPAGSTRSAAEAADTFDVYMTPRADGGTDDNDGRSAEQGVITLRRVEEILNQEKPTTDVRVRIKPGVYYTDPYDWTFYVAGHTITFAPASWEPGSTGEFERPIFRNPGENGGSFPRGPWLHARLPEDRAHPLYDGGDMGLRFHWLHIDCYTESGINLDGDTGRDHGDDSYDPPLRVPGSKGHNGNVVSRMEISRIGTRCAGINDTGGYAAMILTNSRNNSIVDNYFHNFHDGKGRVHGLYITHFSQRNQVLRNRFHTVTGQGLKIRDRSDYQRFEGNRFTKTGWTAFYFDQFCDLQCLKESGANKPRECASYGNEFVDNHLESDSNDGRTKEVALDPPGQTHAGDEGCSIPDGEQRVHASGNTRGG